MKTAFQYSRSNIVFLSVVFAIWLVGLIIAPPKTSGGWGERMGTLTALWLFPTLFAWIFWRLTRRNHSVLSVTFNAVLAISIFGQLTTIAGRARQAVALEKLKGEKSTLSANVIAADGDAEKIDSATAAYQQNVDATFEHLEKTSQGRDAEFYRIMREFTAEIQRNEKQWSDSVVAAMDASVLDFTTLDDGAESERQAAVIRTYIAETQSYRAFFLSIPANMKTVLSPLGEEFPLALGAVRGAKKKIENQSPVMVPLLDAHEGYGETMAEIITFLTKIPGKWTYADEAFTFTDGADQEQFDAFLQEMARYEETVNDLVEKLVPLL